MNLPAKATTVAIIGASGRTGRAVSRELQDAGHRVIPVSRSAPDGSADAHRRADVLDPDTLIPALDGADAVVVTLGISENPLTVRLRGARTTAADVRSRGTANVIEAMRSVGARRLVVLSSFGVGESVSGLSPTMRMVVAAMLAPQFRDHAEQEALVRASGLNWTIARPVNLVESAAGRPAVIADEQMRTVSMHVGLAQVAQELARWAVTEEHMGRTVALSS